MAAMPDAGALRALALQAVDFTGNPRAQPTFPQQQPGTEERRERRRARIRAKAWATASIEAAIPAQQIDSGRTIEASGEAPGAKGATLLSASSAWAGRQRRSVEETPP